MLDFLIIDDWADEKYVLSCEFSERDEARLAPYADPDTLRDYLYDNSVYKCSTIAGAPSYFIPRINIGALSFSVQVNFPIWQKRLDRLPEGATSRQRWESSAQLITPEEFYSIRGELLEFRLEIDGVTASTGQLTLKGISEIINAILYNKTGTIEIKRDY